MNTGKVGEVSMLYQPYSHVSSESDEDIDCSGVERKTGIKHKVKEFLAESDKRLKDYSKMEGVTEKNIGDVPDI